MTAHDLLFQLREKGVEINSSGDDRLIIDAPKGTITEDLRKALAAHKADLLQILKAEATGKASGPEVAETPELVQTESKAAAKPVVAPSEPHADDAIAARAAEEIARLESELMRLRTEEEARRAEVEAARLSIENGLRTEQERWRKIEEETARNRAEKEKQRIEVEAREQAEEEHRRQIAEQELARAEGELKRMRAMEEGRRAEVDAHLRAARKAHEAELAALKKTEEEHAGGRAQEERRYLETELRKKSQEDELRRHAEMRFRVVAEQIERVQAREDARLKAAEESQRLAEEAARHRAEEDARRKAEAQAQSRAEEEARLRAEIEAQMRAKAEERRRAEDESRRRAEEEARLRAEEEAQRLAAEQARRLAEEEAQRRASEEARRQAAEAARLVAQEEARRQAEAQALRRAEEEVRLRAEAEARQRAELEARIRAEIEAKIRSEDAAREESEAARRQTEHERIVALEVGSEPAKPEVVENERSEADERASLEAPVQGGHPEPRVTEIAEWFDAGVENRNQVQAVEASTPMTSPDDQFGTMQDDAGGEFAPVSLPESNLAREAVGISAEMLDQLASEKPAERAAAVSDLPRFGGEDAYHHISSAFDDQSVEVRSAAARAMFELQEDRAAAFTRAMREATPERRRNIGSAIASSGLAGEAVRNLTGESRDKTYDAFSLLFLMCKAGETQPLMRAIEEHPNIEVRLAVVKLLALSGQPEILPAFRRMAVRGSLPPEVRSAVMEAIYQITSQSPAEAPSTL